MVDDLDAVMQKPAQGSEAWCSRRLHPVNLNKMLPKIRFLVPVHTEVTPGERSLEKPDLDVLQALIPGLSRNLLGLVVATCVVASVMGIRRALKVDPGAALIG